AQFVMVAGDVINDDLDLFPRQNRLMGKIGVPVWNAPGNHDLNFKSPNQRYSTQTFIRTYGPDYYSFDYGDTHFVALNNVYWKGNLQPFDPGRFGNDPRCGTGTPSRGRPATYGPDPLPDGTAQYRGQVHDMQLEWLRNDLAQVPRDKLVVLYMHIPLKTLALSSGGTVGAGNINTVNLDAVLDALGNHDHVYSFSGHDTSNSWQVYIGEEEGRSARLTPVHHHVLAEVRGDEWGGPFNDRGSRLADMEDGNPNGYYLMTFDGNKYSTRFKGAAKASDEQMRINVGVSIDEAAVGNLNVQCPSPDSAPAGNRDWVVADVFDGSPLNVVEMSLNGGPYQSMEHMVRAEELVAVINGRTIVRPAGSAWCLSPWVMRQNDRINSFLDTLVPALSADPNEAAAQEDLLGKTRINFGGNPSGHLWRARVPADL
ncbi:MAG: calcineurin-like phosphoesterase C-terminal domain-containing protein, partial [Salinibacterium sp.]|nr:calcineurin-like phosphoesterase C-terminal domain-containing protein [Salinibacterium sp.]